MMVTSTACHGYKSISVVRQEAVKIVLVLLFQIMIQASANTLYVSKSRGNDDANTCRNMTSPCRTLHYVINMTSSNDVIMMDGKDTEEVPYDTCPSESIAKALTFYSWYGTPILNCSGKGLNFKRTVGFHDLKFLDTFLKINDASVTIEYCSFGCFLQNATFLHLIDVSINASLAEDPGVTITNTKFLEKNNAGALSVVNGQHRPLVFVEISNVTVIGNLLEKANSVISIQGYVNFNFMNSEISKTNLPSTVWPLLPYSLIVYFSGCQEANMKKGVAINTRGETFSKADSLKDGKLGTKEERPSGFDQDFTTTTFSLRGLNFSLNNVGIVLIEFCGKVNVSITNTNAFNNWCPDFCLVVKMKVGILCGVIITNCTFVSNYGNGAIVAVDSPHLTLSVTKCHFSHNKVKAVYVITYLGSAITIRKSVIQFSRPEESSYDAQIYITFHNSSNPWAVAGQQDAPNSPVKAGMERSGRLRWDSPLETKGVLVEDCQFYNNTSTFARSAVLIVRCLEAPATRNATFTYLQVRRCTFVDNVACDGNGAIYTGQNIGCNISDSTFISNNGGFGSGAVGFEGTTMFLQNCTLDSNNGGYTTSTHATGSVRMTGMGKAVIQDSRIIQRNTVHTVSKSGYKGTLAISSDSFDGFVLSNSTLDMRWAPSLEKVIVVEITHTNTFILEHGTSIQCPWGYKIKYSQRMLISRSFECILCTMGSYSIDRGVYRDNKSNAVECLQCPYGGKCRKGLEALPNFWGYKIQENPPTIQFHRCPIGYCCQETSGKGCVPYNTCNADRAGRLCGVCKPGYTETLFTPSCRKSEKCKDNWFWPMAVIFVLGLTLYLIIQPDIPGILRRSIVWFRTTQLPVLEPDETHPNTQDFPDEMHPNNHETSGLERIVFFYYQAINILSIQGSYNTVWENHLTQFILGLFNFDMRLNREGFACPFAGLNPVSKLLFHTLGVFSVLLAIPCIFLLHKALSMCFTRRSPKTGIYLSAFLKAVFLGYTVLAQISLTLLKCVTVDGVTCLFVNCNIECYTWWQMLIWTLVLVYFFPFVFVIFFGAKKLYKKQISAAHFFLAFLLPLPALSYWLLNRRHFDGVTVADTSGQAAITSVLIGSYRIPDHTSAGAVYWESVLVGRILVLILASLIKDPFLSSLTLLLLCIVNLSLHIHVLPFERVLDNRAETISLFSLILIAMFNLPFTAYLSEGVVPTGPMSKVMNVFMWCQVVLVGFLPLIYVLLALIAIFSQAARVAFLLAKGARFACAFCFNFCHCLGCNRQPTELDDPLIG